MRVQRTFSAPHPTLEQEIAHLMRRGGGICTWQELRALGLSTSAIDRRVRAGRLFVHGRRVYGLSPLLPEPARLRAAVLSGGEGTVVSHWSALHLLGLQSRPPEVHHVTAQRDGGRCIEGVLVHRTRAWRDGDLARRGDQQTTSVARAILDVAPHSTDAQVTALIRQAQYARLLGDGAMLSCVQRHRGHRGCAAIWRVDPVAAAARGTESPLEDDVLDLLQTLPLPAPRRQVVVLGLSGIRYRADFAYEDAGVLVEADGRDAHERALGREADLERDADLAAVGLLTLRVTSHKLRRSRARTAEQVIATVAPRLPARREARAA